MINRPRAAIWLTWVILLLITPGCLYPQDQTPGNDVSAREAVLTVQDAVNRYQESTGLLPIQNAKASIPAYEKYRLDFGKMKRMGYLSTVPKAAFESGGAYVFLVIDEETKPQVKLLDLAVYQGIDALQKRVDEFRGKHGGANPAGEHVYSGFRLLDLDKLGGPNLKLTSMFSRHPLELLIDDEGRVYADYGADIAVAVHKTETPPRADEDLRHRLADASYFVPVRAPMYRWIGGGPQAIPASNT